MLYGNIRTFTTLFDGNTEHKSLNEKDDQLNA